MERAIEIAKLSIPEDDRHHPIVGAVLADENGREILTCYRGQGGNGVHAEFALLGLAAEQGIDLRDKTLFVTLEPCSRRSPGKIPCAVRVARSGIKAVYVGTLDPNPQIIGRGINHLVAEGIRVEHFPADLRKTLIDLNVAFQGTHAYLVDPIVSNRNDEIAKRQRAGVLTTTLDIIAFSKEELRISTGDTSWLEELFVGLLEASLQGCAIRMIAQKLISSTAMKMATSIGIEVLQVSSDRGIRATISSEEGTPRKMVVVEQEPARHGQIFSAPHDNVVLQTFCAAFDSVWDADRASKGTRPSLSEISEAELAYALRTGIQAYASSKFRLEMVDISSLKFLTNDVELFKLRRAASTNRIFSILAKQPPLYIAGTPWGFFPPIVERETGGQLTLVDGIHRIYAAKHRNEKHVKAMIVADVSQPLPADPLQQWNPKIVAMKRPRPKRYENFDPKYFRKIRQALHAGPWVKG